MDEEETTNPYAASPLDTAAALEMYRTNQSLVQQQIKNNMAMLEQARERIRAQRTGPGQTERLMALSAALLKPTRTGRFSESLGNAAGALAPFEKEGRLAAEERDALLEKYGMQMGNERLRLLESNLSGSGQLLRAAMAANKPAKRRTAISPVDGRIYDLDTGEVIGATGATSAMTAPPPEAVAYLRANPTLAKAFDEKYGVGKAAQYLGVR